MCFMRIIRRIYIRGVATFKYIEQQRLKNFFFNARFFINDEEILSWGLIKYINKQKRVLIRAKTKFRI